MVQAITCDVYPTFSILSISSMARSLEVNAAVTPQEPSTTHALTLYSFALTFLSFFLVGFIVLGRVIPIGCGGLPSEGT